MSPRQIAPNSVQPIGIDAAPDGPRHYFPGRPNRCPDCGHSIWKVGRQSAQCACCDTALPFATPETPTHLGD